MGKEWKQYRNERDGKDEWMGKEWKQYRNERDGKDGGRMNVLRNNESNTEIRKRK